jgi:Cys-tRNA(Pro)/Cys-tRNA(Cys) deacylase
MSASTRATKALEHAGIPFTVHRYEYDPDADSVGVQAAAALGEAPDRVLKTLMTLVDGKPACVILPSDCEVSMKRLATALEGKSAQMMKPADAERLTGYKVGGISPFGQMRKVPVVLEQQALKHEVIYLNGGQRGLQVRLKPADAVRLLAAGVAEIVAD